MRACILRFLASSFAKEEAEKDPERKVSFREGAF
jgi:hypothetical protein